MVISDSGQEHVLILVIVTLLGLIKIRQVKPETTRGNHVGESSNKHGSKAKLGLQRSGDDGSNGWG